MKRPRSVYPCGAPSIYERRRALLLEAVGYMAEQPLAAIVGTPEVADIIALAKGIRRRRPGREPDMRNSVVCYCAASPPAKNRIAEFEETLEAFEYAARRRRRRRTTELPAVVRFVMPSRAQPRAWEDDIAALVQASPTRFGAILHSGYGYSCGRRPYLGIKRQLEMLAAMITDSTTLVLGALEQVAPTAAYKYLRRHGWAGLLFDTAGLAVLQPDYQE